MGILGIKNRTENWRTARTFAPFFNDENLKRKLIHALEPSDTDPEYVKLELFWKGMRDYIHAKGGKEPTAEKLADIYNQSEIFGDLRSKIIKDGLGLKQLKPKNYALLEPETFRENLKNTEIDIVLQTPNYLYIGEAKDQSGFHADGKLVLVHQLIRQYVMANILVSLTYPEKKVVPFIVRNQPKREDPAQVQFMLTQEWLRPENMLTWKKVEDLVDNPV